MTCLHTLLSRMRAGKKTMLNAPPRSQKKYDYVFTSTHDGVIKELMRRNEKFYIVYPYRHCKDEYVERFKKRGNSDEYIKRFMNRWDLFLNNIENLMHVNKIALRRGQYLSDVLLRIR